MAQEREYRSIVCLLILTFARSSGKRNSRILEYRPRTREYRPIKVALGNSILLLEAKHQFRGKTL